MRSPALEVTQTPRLEGSKYQLITIIAVVLTVLAALPVTLTWGPSWVYHIDIDVYREGGRAFLDGDNLYEQSYEVGGITLPFTYPPLAAMLFAPLALIPYQLGSLIFTLGSAVILWWCITIILRHSLSTWADSDHRKIGLWIMPLALLAEPVWETQAFGQINIVLMAFVLIDVLARRTWLPRGVLIGLAAALKLTPAVFFLVFLVNRQWRAAATTVASGVGFTLIAVAISPGNSLTYWLETLSDPSRIGGLAYAANQSIRGTLTRFGDAGADQSSLPWLILMLITLAAIILAMVRVERHARLAGKPAQLGLVLLASLVALLCSPVSWSHHWTWLIPWAVALWAAALTGRHVQPRTYQRTLLILATATTLVVLLRPHWLVPNTNNLEHDWSFWAHLVGNSYVILAIIFVLTGMLMPRLFVPRTARTSQASAGLDEEGAATPTPVATEKVWSWVVLLVLAPVVALAAGFAINSLL